MAHFRLSRRKFIKTSAVATAGIITAPYISCGRQSLPAPMRRNFGKLNHEVTSLALGGQASIQWTPEDVNPVNIILKAFDMGLNYFDTSNLYGPSQTNFGKAFKIKNLIPGQAEYDDTLRRSIFLTSKTHIRWAKGGLEIDGVNNWTNGPQGSHTIDDVKRSLSQIFGDGKGNYPAGACLDMVLIHSLTNLAEVDVLYRGVSNPDPKEEHIGALAALRDLRDGTNLTGLNPGEEKLIRHIGFSGHYNAGVMMEMIRRDEFGILDGLLVSINANDKLNFNMQHNVIPVAQAKDMGVIGMKVFADGAMYTKEAEWSNEPKHVVRNIGSASLPSGPLVKYSLTTPGVNTVIIGIGQVDDNPENCQLHQNFLAAQVTPDGLSASDREDIEKMARQAKEGKTNYFQIPEGGLTTVQDLAFIQTREGEERKITLTWNSAYAGNDPIDHYEILLDGNKIADVPKPLMSQFLTVL